MGIFLIHKHIVQKFMSVLTKYMPDNTPVIFSALTGSIAALAVSLIICAVIGRYVPEMLGKSARNEIQIMP